MIQSVVLANDAISRFVTNQQQPRSAKAAAVSAQVSENTRELAKLAPRNRNLNPKAIMLMNEWFETNIDNPYPSKECIEELAAMGGAVRSGCTCVTCLALNTLFNINRFLQKLRSAK